MKVLHLSNSDGGGAGRAAFRLHQGLNSIGVMSQMLVRHKGSDSHSVLSPQTKLEATLARGKQFLDSFPLKLYPKRESTMFSLQWFPNNIRSKIAQLTPDIINLHWVTKGYLPIEAMARFTEPVVWTLHDMWPFTGGCHYTLKCEGYQNDCGSCPHLGSSTERDLSRWVWQRKTKAWQNINLTLISPSRWLAQCAKSSSLFQQRRIEVIPNGIDIQVYKPVNRLLARNILNLPIDKKLVLFGAMSPTSNQRKGFHLLQPALKKLSNSSLKDQVELVIFGASTPSNVPDLGFSSHYLGTLNDEISLGLVYAAADVFVAPSLQDNLPNTVVESLACGTPCVGFKIGGIPDMIDHHSNGYLATPYEVEDLAEGIKWVLENSESEKLAENARKKAEQEFSMELQAQRYLKVFTELLKAE